MTGNDIISRGMMISLKRPFRYAEKILNSIEMKDWSSSGHLAIDLWKYWACKEAAYKIYIKKGGSRILNPKNFEAEFEGVYVNVKDLYHKELYSGKLVQNEEYMHATLWEQGDQVKSRIISLLKTNSKCRSQQLQRSVTSFLGSPYAMLLKSDRNIPFINGWDISLSHCGGWGAWSVSKVRSESSMDLSV